MIVYLPAIGLLSNQITFMQDPKMLGHRLPCDLEMLRYRVRCLRFVSNQSYYGSSFWICYGLEYISSSHRSIIYATVWLLNNFIFTASIWVKYQCRM
ncbi:hypothetical protein D3C87_189330 [compost metagenome]